MALLIDSSVFIDMERNGHSLDELSLLFPGESLAFASITASELLVGVHRADTPSRRTLREAWVERIIELIDVLTLDLEVARLHAKLSVDLYTSGLRIGDHDLIIAATSLTHGHDVLTSNVREFERVPGLVVRQPGW